MLLTPTIIRLGVVVASGPIPKRKDAAMLISFRKKLYLHEIILFSNLLQLRHLKSQITFHPFVLLYNNYTLHHSYKKRTKTDREKRLETF